MSLNPTTMTLRNYRIVNWRNVAGANFSFSILQLHIVSGVRLWHVQDVLSSIWDVRKHHDKLDSSTTRPSRMLQFSNLFLTLIDIS